MADPVISKVIGVKVGAANIGETVIVRNLSRGGKLTGAVAGTDRSINLNAAPATAWQEGDLIQGEIRGRVAGAKQETIKKGGATIRISATADTSSPSVNL